MRTLHLHLARQTLIATAMTVAVFAFVLLLGNLIREIFALLVNQNVRLALVAEAVGLLLPYVLVFALPFGLLTATLLTFGRFSADQELTAARAGGVSLLALVAPVLLLAVLASVVCAWVNLSLAPRTRVRYKNLLYSVSHQRPDTILPEGRFIHDIPGLIVYVRKIEGENLTDVLLSRLDKSGQVEITLRAERGRLRLDAEKRQVFLTVYDARASRYERAENRWQPSTFKELELDPITLPEVAGRQLKLNEMTFWDLRQQLRELERRGPPPGTDATTADLASPLRTQMHQQVSFSFACFSFALVGIPLGIRAHRRETSIGFAVALVLVLLYYGFFILSQALAPRAQLLPHLICWIPNLLFQGIGLVLLHRANRQ